MHALNCANKRWRYAYQIWKGGVILQNNYCHMNFTDNQIMAYSEAHTTPENEVLHDLSRFTHLTEMIPQMLAGGFQGKFLEFVSYMVKPACILEIGTFTGYSAICLAKGLRPGGVAFRFRNILPCGWLVSLRV